MSAEPSVGRIVHYVSYGSPVQSDGTQVFESVCRAAVITEVDLVRRYGRQSVGLAVLNPTGMFFNQGVPYASHLDALTPGTWHWPERTPE
jgi:hypothetical protein